jgi:hypothetical protein
MKNDLVRIAAFPASVIGMLALTGCVMEPTGAVYAEPLPTPAPVVVQSTVMIPDYYVWDGYEYVGVVGTQYCYLAPGLIWVSCEPWREHRFHDWEHRNPRWRDHAVRNDRFRHGPDGRFHPIGEPVPPYPHTPPPPPRKTGPLERDSHPQHSGYDTPQRPAHQANPAPGDRRSRHPESRPNTPVPPHPGTPVPPRPNMQVPPPPNMSPNAPRPSHPSNVTPGRGPNPPANRPAPGVHPAAPKTHPPAAPVREHKSEPKSDDGTQNNNSNQQLRR